MGAGVYLQSLSMCAMIFNFLSLCRLQASSIASRVKHNSPVVIHHHTVAQHSSKCPRKHQSLQVSALPDHVLHTVSVDMRATSCSMIGPASSSPVA